MSFRIKDRKMRALSKMTVHRIYGNRVRAWYFAKLYDLYEFLGI